MTKYDNSLLAVPQSSIPKNGASHLSIRLVITVESSKVCERSQDKVWLNKEYRQNVRNYIQPMAEIIHLGIWTQDVFGIQHLPGFQPLWVVRVDGQVRGCTHLFVYLLGPNPYVCKGPTLVIGPVIKVAPMMQLVENIKPTVQIWVSPVRLDDRIRYLVCSWINIRLVRGHSINSQRVQNRQMPPKWSIKLSNITTTMV